MILQILCQGPVQGQKWHQNGPHSPRTSCHYPMMTFRRFWGSIFFSKIFVWITVECMIWAIGPNKPSEQTPGDGDPALYKHLDMNKLIYVPSLVKANFLPSENMNIFAMLTFIFPHKNSRPLIRSLFSLETKHFPHSPLLSDLSGEWWGEREGWSSNLG